MKTLPNMITCCAVALLLLSGCAKQDRSETPPNPARDQRNLGKSGGHCYCISPVPGNCPQCVNDLMKGKEEQKYTITWQSCEDNCAIKGTSYIKFCYADPDTCAKLAMEITGVPKDCLPCIPDPYCVIGKVDCQKGNTASFSYTDPNDGTVFAVTFVGDPKITISCEGSDKVYHTCTGDANPQ